MPKLNSRLAAFTLFLFLASSAFARVISYSPYSSKPSFPGVQERTNRFFAMVEGEMYGWGGILLSPIPYSSYPFGKLVLYDVDGEQEPRVVFPVDGSEAAFSVVAVRESRVVLGAPIDLYQSTILIQTNANHLGTNASRAMITLLSVDSGRTWKQVELPAGDINQMPGNGFDVGGRFAKSRYSPVRVGTSDTPFIVHVRGKGIFSISSAGTAKLLASVDESALWTSALLGSNHEGTRFLVRQNATKLVSVGLDGSITPIGTFATPPIYVEGWITPAGDTYLDIVEQNSQIKLRAIVGGQLIELGPSTTRLMSPLGSPAYMVPTADYSGAWIIDRATGSPTVLSRHSSTTGLQVQWSDVSGPEVEAIHPGASGNTLMIQVHRDRPQADQRIFIDPALAVWHVGEPAPKEYDELFLSEQPTKGFVHLDVDAAAGGAPFVFDSGVAPSSGGVIVSPAPPSGGGGDVIQEWGVVRASLKQKLVLPGIGRTRGAYGSDWVSDVILQNPLDVPQRVTLTLSKTGVPLFAARDTAVVTLEAREVRLIPDIARTIFHLEDASGALFLLPDSAITATSRTYTRSTLGTYGFNMNAIDVFTAAGARFPLTFAGAFLGGSFRTNIILTDAFENGSAAQIAATGPSGIFGAQNATVSVPVGSQQQMNSISTAMNLLPTDTGGIMLTPSRGSVIASVFAIDNRTNDPTYFPPDLSSSVVRTIPAVGHVDGANGSRFRSDLYLFNPSTTSRGVMLLVKAWDSNVTTPPLTLTLLPKEARVIRDFLMTAFYKTGIARLQYDSGNSPEGIRVTSRTYTIDDNGGTYGFLMPPLNNFQAATSGDTLEILGAIHDARFRTNLGLVELTLIANGLTAAAKIEILDDRQRVVDSFTVNVAVAGGMQINDIFRARNIAAADGTPMMIRVSPISGTIGAYASVVDNGTNDPSYVAANLSAKQ